MDADSDNDLVCISGNVFWLENLDGRGNFSDPHLIQGGIASGADILVHDVDLDGFLDILITDSGNAGSLGWFQNLDGTGLFSPFLVISSYPSLLVAGAHLDGDAYVDWVTVQGRPGSSNHPNTRWFSSSPTPVFGSFGTPVRITESAFNGVAVCAADWDGDGDLDLASASTDDRTVAWYENTDSAGTFGSQQLIASISAWSLVAGDMDRDGDKDLVVGALGESSIIWFENADGRGSFSISHLVNGLASNVRSVVVIDVNGDGIPDLASAEHSSIAWYLNLDGNGKSWARYVVGSVSGRGYDVWPVDIDGDGDMDLAAAAVDPDQISWYRNLDGNGTFAAESVVSTAADAVQHVVSADFDGDGDQDLASTSYDDQKVAWYENLDGNGAFGAQIVLSTSMEDAWSIDVGDIDNDGDIDIIASARSDDIAWFENLDGAGSFGPKTLITTFFDLPRMAILADLDGDGDLDIATASEDDDTIGWIPQLTRTAFVSFPNRTLTAPSVPTYPHCPTPFSFDCLAATVNSLSLCTRDTLILPPDTTYTCGQGTHLEISRSVRIQASLPGSTGFSCDGGVLFRSVIRSDGAVVGNLDLVGLAFEGTGMSALLPQSSSAVDSLAVPGLRVDGAGARLSLVNCTVSNGVSTISPLLLGGGTGGCLLASGGGLLELVDSVVEGCSASNSGGGAGAIGSGSEIRVTRSTLRANTAGSSGGGLALADGSSGTVDSSWVVDNMADQVGGGLWVSPLASQSSVIDSRLSGNTAVMGGGMALAFGPFSYVSPTGSVADIPSGTRAQLAGEGGGEPATLSVHNTDIQGNRAVNVGGGLYVCDTRVDVSGLGTSWGDNQVDGASTTTQSSGEAFLCAVPDESPLALALDRTSPGGIPWLRVEEPLFSSSSAGQGVGWRLHGPISRMIWVTQPATSVEAGGDPGGVVGVEDVFGLSVEYLHAVVQTDVVDNGGSGNSSPDGNAPVLGPVVLPPVFAGSSRVELPPMSLQVRLAGLGAALPDPVPVNVTLTVRLAESLASRGVAPPELVWPLNVQACGVGRGGLSSDASGLLSCVVCSPGTGSTITSFESCVGEEPCPDNAVRLLEGGGGGSATGLGNGTDEVTTLGAPCYCVRGFWTPSGTPDVACEPCPVGGFCPGGLSRPRAAPGFYPAGGESTIFLACPNPDACVGSGKCQAGYEGRMCARCQQGYYALRGACLACESTVNVSVFALLAACALGACLALLSFNLAEGVRYKFAAASIGFAGLQVSALYGRLELDWGEIAEVYFDAVSSVNLNLELTSPECSLSPGTDAWMVKLILTLALPVFVALGLLVAALVVSLLILGHCGWFGKKNLAQLKGAYVRAWFQGLVLLYLPLTSASLSPFGCRKDETGKWILDADPARSCYDGAWWRGLFPVGVSASVIYAFALPCTVVGLLYWKKQQMAEHTFRLRFGFLLGRFDREFWWFEAAIMGRKLMVVVCMTFFFTQDGKANGAVFALAASFAHLVYSRPYLSRFHNGLAVVVLAATTTVLFAGTFVDFTLRRVGILAGITVNVLAIVIGNVIDVVRLARMEKAIEENEFFVEGVFSMDAGMSDVSLCSQPETMRDDSVELSVMGDALPSTVQRAGVGTVGTGTESTFPDESQEVFVHDSVVVSGVETVGPDGFENSTRGLDSCGEDARQEVDSLEVDDQGDLRYIASSAVIFNE